MKYQCSNHNDPRCRLCSHEKPHKEAQRWLTKEGCTEEGFFCELTGKNGGVLTRQRKSRNG